ncbi:hypothetical protein AK812_SmicGene5481 [Symbiodinium microadriaticum]|uniref:Uncharacterized protein n=1 Tax=Symbiodinium microadriaticum TaxID=2951 RepID=A0A1Q9ETJ6_SYMMI|nr:hypothetical protein AK812_SmicGene5481 [Symbiodinium microadriaticum]
MMVIPVMVKMKRKVMIKVIRMMVPKEADEEEDTMMMLLMMTPLLMLMLMRMLLLILMPKLQPEADADAADGEEQEKEDEEEEEEDDNDTTDDRVILKAVVTHSHRFPTIFALACAGARVEEAEEAVAEDKLKLCLTKAVTGVNVSVPLDFREGPGWRLWGQAQLALASDCRLVGHVAGLAYRIPISNLL